MEVLVGGQHSNFVSGFEEVLKTPSSLGNKAAAAAKSSIERRSLRETEGRQKEDSFADKEAAAAMRHCSTTKTNQHISSGMCQNPLYIYHRSKNFSILSRNHFFPYTGWWFQPLWKILVNGKDDIPYVMENNPNVPNHQPEMEGASTNEIRILTKIWRLNQRKISFRISNIPFTARKKMSFANQPAASHGNIHVLPARPPWFHH